MNLKLKEISPSIICIVGLVTGLLIGLSVSYIYFQPKLDDAAEVETTLGEIVEQLEEDAEGLNIEIQKSEEAKAEAEAQAEELLGRLNEVLLDKDRVENLLAITNNTLAETLLELDAKKVDLKEVREEVEYEKDQYEKLSNQIVLAENALEQLVSSRTLLAEFRKEMPTTRNETKSYWENMKSFAVKIDPSLGDKVDNVLTYVDEYFDWIDSAPGEGASLEDFALWILIPPQGAMDYDTAIDEFLSEVYLMIIRDIDTALEAIG